MTVRRATSLLLLALAVALVAGGVASANPFGVARPEPALVVQSGPLAGLFGWIAARQAEFYKAMSALVTALRTDPSAAWTLAGVSFLYGLFHAAGPGHGKVVITSYLVATGETVRRGVVLAFMSAFAQAVTAIVIVTVMTVVLRATSLSMTRATGLVEIVSYALIALIGARLVYSKGAALLSQIAMPSGLRPAAAGGAPVPGDHHGHDHHHDHHHGHHHGHGHDCAHAPDPATLAGPWSLRRAWAAVLAVGLRPCTGAILVLVFAFAQGVYAAGVAATLAMALGTGAAVATLAGLAVGARGIAVRLADGGAGWAVAGLHALELLAALAVLAFGLLLLGGALSGGV